METSIVTAVKGIVERNGRLLIVRRAGGDATGAGTWEQPGGKIDFGEHPEAALRREVKEETGLDVTVGNVAYVTSFLTSPVRQVVIIAYRCEAHSDDVTLSYEHSDYRWADRAELEALLPKGILADLKRCGALPE